MRLGGKCFKGLFALRFFRQYVQQCNASNAGGKGHDAGWVILTVIHEQMIFFADASRMEEIKELSVNICLMARIQPADHTSDDEPSCESAFISESRSQTQKEMDELIVHVSEKTYAYGAIRAENQDLLSTISELKTRLEKVEKGMNATSSDKRPKSRDSHVKTSVLDVSKNEAKKEAVYVRKNKQTNNTFAKVVSNKENVIDVAVANASKAKTLLCVSCMQNVPIPCHDKCVAKHNLNTLDTTYVASKSKIDEASASKARDKVVQIVLWVVDSGCSKHMTGDRSLLRNFVEKFMGTVRFGNDNFAAITGYGDYIHGNITICHVYYVEGLGHNLFSVGQFCDGDLEVAFRSNTCYVRNLEGDDLLTGGRDSNLYTISISDMAASSPICLMSKATSTKSWLWHRRLSHLNFGTINDLTKLDLVDGLPKFKYGKDHLCSACERGKSKKASHPPKLIPSDYSKLELLHMDLCGPMRVASVNGKKYILVIVDDFSRFTWVYFLRSKDETPEIIKKFIAQAQLNYKAKVCKIRTDNGTEFKNATLKAYYEKLGIMQQFSIARTPQQNGVVERRNRTLVEAARTMLIFSRLPEFLWAEAVATCFTQNRSIINARHNKTPYELLLDKAKMLSIFMCFGLMCYPTNDRDDLGKMKPKADIGVFIGYSETSRGFRIYNRRTKRIMETIHVKFDELTAIASEHDCLEPELQRFNNQNSSDDLMNTPSKEDLDNLFVPYDSLNHEEIKSSTTNLEPSNVQNFHQVQSSNHIWTKDHPLDQVIGDPSKPVMTRQRLHTDSEVCMYALTVSTFEPKNIKEAMADHKGKNVIALKWLWKNKCDADNIVVRNKTRLVAKGYKQEEGIDFEESICPYYSLKKLNYVLKQAPRAWYDKLSSFLIEHGFNKGIIDPTLFTRRHGGDILLVQVYVDDIIFGSTNPDFSKRFANLMKNNFEMSMMGELKFFLGLQAIERLDVDLQGSPTDQTTYRRMIVGLMYLTSSRPDIAYATFVCARYQARPTVKYLKEVKRIFGYLRHSHNMGLWYPKDFSFELIAYSDADHAGCKDDCKSTPGGLQFLGEKLMSWSSKKQDCTAMSTTEAEYVSLSACCAQVIWMRTQLLDYGYKYNRIPMYCDSKSAIAISCNSVQHSKTKHIDIRYHFIKEHVEKGTMELYFVSTEYQLADLFTKALPKERFEYLVYRIGMRCMTPTQLDCLTNNLHANNIHAADVHPDELCPYSRTKRYDLMDANKKVDLEHHVSLMGPTALQIKQMFVLALSITFIVIMRRLLWEGTFTIRFRHPTSSIPYLRFTKDLPSVIILDICPLKSQDVPRQNEDTAWMITEEEMKHTVTNPNKEAAESALQTITMIRLRYPLIEKANTAMSYSIAPVPNVDKADEIILQDTLQVSLAEHKSREEQEARENVALVDEHLASEEIDKMVDGQENVVVDSTRIEPRSDKESPEVEIAKEKEVEISKEKEVELTKETKLQGCYGYLFVHIRARFMPRKSFDTLADNLHDVMVETLSAMVDKHIKEQVVKQVPEQVRNQVPERRNIQAQIKTHIDNAIADVIPSQVDASVRSYMSGHILHVHPAQSQTSSVPEQQYQLYLAMKDDPQLQQQDIAICAKRQKISDYAAYVSGESSSGQDLQEEQAPSTSDTNEASITRHYGRKYRDIKEAKLRKMADEMLRRRCTSGDEHQSYGNDFLHREGIERAWKAKGREIISRRANKYLVSITEPDYKNLNKNDIEDIYFLIMNGKVPDYADTRLLWSLSSS
ncbi:retrovirus-related pol polyprotein from transposon TNT 1-94 [Tanacetum coccineum]